jgi:hypothetical protein
MRNRRPYTGTSDGVATAKRAGTEWFVRAMSRRWGFDNLGTWVVRDVRGKSGILSTHATARAADLGYMNTPEARAKAVEVANWLADNANQLGVEAVHDYAYGKYGRGWRCDRQKWKRYTKRDNAGSIGGRWLHVELNPKMADNPTALANAWHSIPKPDKG